MMKSPETLAAAPVIDGRAIFAAAPAPILVIAPDAPSFTIIDVNEAYLAATMRTREGLLGMALFDAMPDDPADGAASGVTNLRSSLERVIETGQTDRMPLQKYAIHRPDGSFEERWWEPVNAPLFGEDGQLVAIVHNVTDATERVRANAERSNTEGRLQQSEQRYRMLFDVLDEGFCVIEFIDGPRGPLSDYVHVEANSAYAQNAGIPDIVGKRLREVVLDKEADSWVERFRSVLLSGQPNRFEQELIATGRHLELAAFPVGDADTRQVAVLFQDVTARKQAEAALRELNETLEEQVAARSAERDRLWSLSQDMLARADYSGMMSAVSPAWTQVLGWNDAELLSRGYATFMHPDDMPPTVAAIERMAETRQPTRFENRIATSDGDWKHIEWIIAPEPDGVNFIAVGRDISRTKTREAELAAAQEALRQSQKMEAMGQLTGGVAHDFNNLLTPIVGSLDMLQRRGVGSEREQRLIGGAMQSAERAKTLVQRLLAFARRQPLQATAVDLPALISGMAGLMGSTLGPTVGIEVELEANLPPVRADSNQLEMALLNLAVNARDAMSEGGVLTVAAERASVRDEASVLATGHYVRLSVSDTGVGMDEATLARAIEPFFSTKGIGKGTGLGLSMVHGLAAQLGGELTIRSRPGEGTSVELWLPISTNAVESEEFVSAARTPAELRGRAILVDDEELVRISTADMLIDLGFEVIEADSAEAALELLRQSPPDVLITDHLMPGMCGSELARTAKALQPGLPVLLVSGYADAEGIASDLPRLTKPFRKAELATLLESLVPMATAEA